MTFAFVRARLIRCNNGTDIEGKPLPGMCMMPSEIDRLVYNGVLYLFEQEEDMRVNDLVPFMRIRQWRREFVSGLLLEQERRAAEGLLLNVLPSVLARKLQTISRNEGHFQNTVGRVRKRRMLELAGSHSSVTVLFMDIVGFTAFASQTRAHVLVDVHCEGRSHRIWPGTNKSVKAICDEYYGSAARACACAV